MPLVINSNIPSLNSQRQLVKSGMEQEQAMERLSSGKKINTAADDAAGLAIANRMTSQIRGLDRAVANANDGISLVQTAEGALDESTNILQRMRELAIQSANGIYSDADRSTLDAEVQQLKAEVDRIADTTTFNGQKLLDGSLETVKLQVGAVANETISLNIGELDANSLGGKGADIVGGALAMSGNATSLTASHVYSYAAGSASAVTAAAAAALSALAVNTATAGLKINGTSVGDLSTATTVAEAVETMNGAIDDAEITFFVEATGERAGSGVLQGGDYLELTVAYDDGDATTGTYTYNTFQISGTSSLEELASEITSQSGGKIEATVNEEGRLVLNAESAEAMGVAVYDSSAAADLARDTDTVTGGLSGGSFTPSLAFTDLQGDGLTLTSLTASSSSSALSATAMDNLGLDVRTSVGSIGGVTIAATSNSQGLGAGDLVINGVEVGAVAFDSASSGQLDKLVDAINAVSSQTGVVASERVDAGGTLLAALQLTSADGSDISIDFGSTTTEVQVETFTGLQMTNNSELRGNSIANVDVGTQDSAQRAIGTIDKALEQINAVRADMGAVTNRLEFTTSNLMNVSENTSAARSRIVDADFAAETANLSRAQVLQQASQAMLAQANAAPQQVLSLLR